MDPIIEETLNTESQNQENRVIQEGEMNNVSSDDESKWDGSWITR